jgi:hypothetical protein
MEHYCKCGVELLTDGNAGEVDGVVVGLVVVHDGSGPGGHIATAVRLTGNNQLHKQPTHYSQLVMTTKPT